MPGGPLVLIPVVRPADPPGLLRMPGPGPVAVPAIDGTWQDPARRHIGTADHRAPVDGRNENYLLAEPHPPMRPEATSGPAGADLGILVRQYTASLGDGEPGDLESGASSAAFDACLVGVQGRRRTRRPGGTFAEALLAVPSSGAGPSAADLDPRTGRPGPTPGRGRPRPRPVRAASKQTVPARLRSSIIPNERRWLPHGSRAPDDTRVQRLLLHARPLGVSAVLTLAPGCSPWRTRSALGYPIRVTDGGGRVEITLRVWTAGGWAA